MQSFDIAEPTDKTALYAELRSALDGLTSDEPDAIANMANAAALLWEYLPDINWVGFYRLIDNELVLGPFQGKVACIRIAIGAGVCGTAAAKRETQIIADVNAFPGHIPCDVASASELVIPIIVEGELLGVLDIDSPSKARFDTDDAQGCESLVALIGPRISKN